MSVKPVTEAGLKFWIVELLNEDPKRSWLDIEKFFIRELRSGRITLRDLNQARRIYSRYQNVCKRLR